MKNHIALKSFWQNTAGNFSLIGAISLITAVSVMGLGIDAQRNYVLKSDLQSAVDAAAISGALAKSGLGDEASFGERRKAALTSLMDNTKTIELSSAPKVNINPLSGEVRVKAEAKTDHLIMSLFGHKNWSIYAEGKAAYGTASENIPGTIPPEIIAPGTDNEIQDSSNLNHPLSIAFVLDNSLSLLNEFSGDLSEGFNPPLGGRNGPATLAGGPSSAGSTGGGSSKVPISRLNIIKEAADDFYRRLDTMARTNPGMRQNIRTALMPFNDGLDRRYQVGLKPGWARTAAQTKNMQPKRRKLPVESFNSAITQLNNDSKTNSNKARKAIVFMGDGKFDIGYDRTTETQRLIETCQRAKNDGIEIYVMALEIANDKALNPYQICASPNGSISGYGPNQIAVDNSCLVASTAAQQTQCRVEKSEYFSQITSRRDMEQFWARLNPARRPAPDSETGSIDTNNNRRKASVRLIE